MIIEDFEIELITGERRGFLFTPSVIVSVTDLINTENHQIYRYDPSIARKYRDEFGILDFEAFVNDVVLIDIENDDWE